MSTSRNHVAGNCMTHGERLPCYECTVNSEIDAQAKAGCSGCAICQKCPKSATGEHCISTMLNQCVNCGMVS